VQCTLFITTGQCAQTASANVDAPPCAINQHPLALDVWAELPIGRPVRVTDIVPKHWDFTADFTFCHFSPLLSR
jgi:hypothetical protein